MRKHTHTPQHEHACVRTHTHTNEPSIFPMSPMVVVCVFPVRARCIANSVLQYVAARCSVLQWVNFPCCCVLQCVAVCCSALQCVVVCCSVLQCVAVCCNVSISRVVVCCSVLQCVAVCFRVLLSQCHLSWLFAFPMCSFYVCIYDVFNDILSMKNENFLSHTHTHQHTHARTVHIHSTHT